MEQILGFYARADLLVTDPSYRPIIGSTPRYVGRRCEQVDIGGKKALRHPAVEKAYTCDFWSPSGQRLLKLARRDSSLYPADESTAAACGLSFIAVEFSNGEWAPKAAAKAPAKLKAPESISTTSEDND